MSGRGSGSTLLRGLRFAFMLFFPDLAYKLNMTNFVPENLDFFVQIIRKSIDIRKSSDYIKRNDFIDLLMDTIKEDDKLKNLYTEKEVEDFSIANGLQFFFVGNDTSSGALALILLNMALYPDVQEKLYQEVKVNIDPLLKKLKYQ